MPGYGIGAGGVLGIAFEVLPPPVQAVVTTSTSGGTLPTASTYKYYVTAINAVGETAVSNEQPITTGAGSTNSNTVNWASVPNATGYKIYRTAAGGATGTELLLTAVGLVTTYVDTGAITPAGALPTFNSAFQPGTYTAPQKYMPFTNETLKYQQANVYRRPMRQFAGMVGAVPGDSFVDGDIEIEATDDTVPYFMYAARMAVVKSGSNPNFIYTFTPTFAAIPSRTLSITLDRDTGVVFGYVGCVVSAMKFTIANGELMLTITLVGLDEATQATPVATWPTTTPFGAGQYSIEFPTGTPVFDTDTFEYTIDDKATAQYRLKSTSPIGGSVRAAQFVAYGERNNTMQLQRDFLSRADFDAFKAVTAMSVTLTATKGVNNSISFLAASSIKDTYIVNLSGQANVVRATITYQNVLNTASGVDYQFTIKTQENIS